MHDIRRILVPTDFSEGSLAAFEEAVLVAERFDAAIEVLHVWLAPLYTGTETVLVHLPEGPPVPMLDYVRKQAAEELAEFMKIVEKRRIPHVSARLIAGNPLHEIVNASKDYDLLVMGTHGRSGVAHLFLGSVAERVVRKAVCPVLTVRAKHIEKAA